MSGILGNWTGKCLDTRILNNNNMRIGTDVLEAVKASDEYKAGIKNGWYIGYAGHPKETDYQKFEEACIVMRDMNVKDNGEVEGTFDIVDTPVGRVLKAFIDAGVNFGISIRAYGEVGYDGTVSPEDFIFRGFDIVTFPAYNDCITDFKLITASTDPKVKNKYKIVASTLKENIDKIDNAESLGIFQVPLNEASEEYKLIQDKLDNMESETEDFGEVEVTEEVAFLEKKLEAMTNLYLEAFETARKLDSQLHSYQVQVSDIYCSNQRKIRAMKRIVANQNNDMLKEIDVLREKNSILASTNRKLKTSLHQKVIASKELDKTIQAKSNEIDGLRSQIEETTETVNNLKLKNKQLIQANKTIKSESQNNSKDIDDLQSKLESAKNSNLIYKKKIEANTKSISEKDSKISELEDDLQETVLENENLKRDSSNRDAEIENLKKQIRASETIVCEYQQAYADMCAGALGVQLNNIPITAQTRVSELKDYIYGGTSVNSSYRRVELEPFELASEYDVEPDLGISDFDDSVPTL